MLPFASEETLSALEANIIAFGSVSEQLQAGLTAHQISSKLLGGLEASEEGFALAPRWANLNILLPFANPFRICRPVTHFG